MDLIQYNLINDIYISELDKEEINGYSKILNIIFDQTFGTDFNFEEVKIIKNFTINDIILKRLHDEQHKILTAKYNSDIIAFIEINGIDCIPYYFVKTEYFPLKIEIGKKLMQYYLLKSKWILN